MAWEFDTSRKVSYGIATSDGGKIFVTEHALSDKQRENNSRRKRTPAWFLLIKAFFYTFLHISFQYENSF